MYKEKTVFNIKIADTTAEIQCQYPETKEFMHEYLTDQKALFSISPTDDDLLYINNLFKKQSETDGIPLRKYSRKFLENNAVHWKLAESLIEYNVLLMHGSALVLDGNTYIFTAKSGIGKSTHARLWREHFGKRVFMLNDDKPMLKVTSNGVTAYGTPWDGKHHLSRNASAPLKAIIYLTRDMTNHIEPFPKLEAFSVIFRQAYRSDNALKMQKILSMENQIMNTVGIYKLGCNMNPEAAVVAYEGIM